MEDRYCVKWEKHHNAILSVFVNLYKQNVLVDCTLAAENRFIKAHRIVLMACSPYFEDLLSQHCDNYPIVWMNMKFSELQALIDFCYLGEVRLLQAELPGFLNAARLLHIKGLCESSDNYRKRRHTDSVSGGNVKKRVIKDLSSGDVLVNQVSVSADNCDIGDENSDVRNISDEEFGDANKFENGQTNGDSMVHVPVDENSDISDLDTDEESRAGEEKDSIILDDLIRGSGVSQFLYRWTCSKCGEAFPTRTVYHDHKKGCTADPSAEHPWRCHKCPNTYKNKKDLVRHLLYCGNDMERHICDRCGSTYKYERGLKRHKIYCGTDVKPMVCNACGKTYKYKRGLRRHQKQQCGLIDIYLLNNRQVKSEQSPITSLSKVISTPKIAPNVSKIDVMEDEDTSMLTPQSLIRENTPSTCQTCGKVYKYKKPYLNHLINCVPAENDSTKAKMDQDDEEEEEKKEEKMDDSDIHVPDGEDQSLKDVQTDDEKQMDDKAIEDELDMLVALKNELESEDLGTGDKNSISERCKETEQKINH